MKLPWQREPKYTPENPFVISLVGLFDALPTESPAEKNRQGRAGAGPCPGICTRPDSGIVACEDCASKAAQLDLQAQAWRRTVVPEAEQSDGSFIFGWALVTATVGHSWNTIISEWEQQENLEGNLIVCPNGSTDEHIKTGMCNCGFYTMEEIPEMPSLVTYSQIMMMGTMAIYPGSFPPATRVLAKLALWGTVSYGYEGQIRSSHAKLDEIIIPDDSPYQMTRGLQEHYPQVAIISQSEFNARQETATPA